jgi:ribosomal protein RSM22 (predicted rRNA methylase)
MKKCGLREVKSPSQTQVIVLFVIVVHLFTFAYIVWVISPPCPHTLPCPSQFQAGLVLPLSLILLKKRHKHNKEDKAFLLVELRIVIQRDSYCCFK